MSYLETRDSPYDIVKRFFHETIRLRVHYFNEGSAEIDQFPAYLKASLVQELVRLFTFKLFLFNINISSRDIKNSWSYVSHLIRWQSTSTRLWPLMASRIFRTVSSCSGQHIDTQSKGKSVWSSSRKNIPSSTRTSLFCLSCAGIYAKTRRWRAQATKNK